MYKYGTPTCGIVSSRNEHKILYNSNDLLFFHVYVGVVYWYVQTILINNSMWYA